jgi:ribonuclease HI
MVHLEFKATNNMAEYDALIFGLNAALSLGVRQLHVKGDSQLIIKQVKGKCCYNDPQLVVYLHHIPRAENAVVDDLSTKASTWTQTQMASLKDGYSNR